MTERRAAHLLHLLLPDGIPLLIHLPHSEGVCDQGIAIGEPLGAAGVSQTRVLPDDLAAAIPLRYRIGPSCCLGDRMEFFKRQISPSAGSLRSSVLFLPVPKMVVDLCTPSAKYR